jgi:LAS superfamily LD-carboxypeptidase LdcB
MKLATYFALLILFALLNSCNEHNNQVEQAQSSETKKNDPIPLAIDSEFYKLLLTGQLSENTDSVFSLLPERYTSKPIYVHKEVVPHLLKMIQEASKEGIHLTIISGYRSFSDQKRIWERKWAESSEKDERTKALQIMKYSAMPKTSRHHWGTDVDINSVENSYFESGRGLKEYEWLQKNAISFGFHNVYDNKASSGRKGYEMEKWHWSYLPISEIFLDYYNQLIQYTEINGFSGSNSAQKCNAIEEYVNGISIPKH